MGGNRTVSLTANQMRAAELIFQGRSQHSVANELGVKQPTVWKWTQKPEWQAYVEDLMAATRRKAIQELGELVAPAVDALKDAIKDPEASHADRTRAAVAVLDRVGIGPHSFPHSDPDALLTDEDIDRALDEYIADHGHDEA